MQRPMLADGEGNRPLFQICSPPSELRQATFLHGVRREGSGSTSRREHVVDKSIAAGGL
jgi:hypothetical protein